MAKSKRDESTDTEAGSARQESSWLSATRFFPKRRAEAGKEAAERDALAAKLLRRKQSRLRVKAALDHRTELVAAEIAIYKAAFMTNEERRQNNPAFFYGHSAYTDASAKEAAIEPDRKDPDTWPRPNLDKLKESILADWRADHTSTQRSSAA